MDFNAHLESIAASAARKELRKFTSNLSKLLKAAMEEESDESQASASASNPRRRGMSAEGRARVAAAQKARWEAAKRAAESAEQEEQEEPAS